MQNEALRSVLITPDFAKTLLNLNENNRPKNWKIINNYAEDMRQGRWKLNGETVKLTTDGFILDGQHRLEACILSKTPFETYVATVKDRDSFDTIDIGRKRSGADTLSILGEKNAKALAAVLNYIDIYKAHGRLISRTTTFTPIQVEEALKKYPEARESVTYVVSNGRAVDLVLPRLTTAFCHYIFSAIDPEEAEKFLDAVIYGENIARGNPVWALRNRLMAERTQSVKGNMHKFYVAALVCKAWNLYRTGKSCALLKLHDTEDFPKPI